MAVTMGIAEVSVPRFYDCDGCGKHLDADSGEAQEMLHWEHRGAYASIFGDGENLSLDLCQECVMRLLGPLIQRHGNSYFPANGNSKT